MYMAILYFNKKHTSKLKLQLFLTYQTAICFMICAKQIYLYNLIKIDTFASINMYSNGIKTARKNS